MPGGSSSGFAAGSAPLIQVSPALDISLTPIIDIAALAPRWRALEARSQGGFFRAWEFISAQAGCCAAPRLLAVRQGGEDLALALVQRARGRVLVGETGSAAHDSLFIEHNGVLLRRGAEAVLPAALRALCRRAPVILSGVDDVHLAAARGAGRVLIDAERMAPQVDLTGGGEVLDRLSANARGQVRRALRLYGDPAIAAAPDPATALAWFAAMLPLHEARWAKLGKQGAFAGAVLRRFHEGLIAHGHGAGGVDMLRVTAGADTVGYLYNFRHGGHVLAYQSGFAPAPSPRHKPGLVSHVLAIGHYRAAGAVLYDLLAGAQRYKTTLSGGHGQALYWLTLYPRAHPAGLARQGMHALRGWVSAAKS